MIANEIRAGQMIGTYQAQAQAPVSYISGTRQRAIDGHLVSGSWADPWWLYSPEDGWAIARAGATV